ncbi:MAG: rod shape-determining protein MreD [Propionivibrio sp.]|uniref:rod shape-determining protein MreD n=1 Tax=Propionivibrio sp. TaxID=2212460 RepID=UPI001A469132|nr:rod shape-determining protein MreD [Propionivibrio sp.]MBL8416272.1 rod shape-determining protein MreD [Propionivibrio sp.]
MQPTYSSSRILQPVRPWFVLISLATALVFNFFPTTAWPWMPDWVALLIIFWSIREPRHVGMGTGFILGLTMDVADSSLLGQHALAYVLASYAATSLSRRILWFPLGQQALHILPLLLMVQLVQFAVRVMPGADSPGLSYFVGPFFGALLWLPLTFALLLPQYQPVDRDANRPI